MWPKNLHWTYSGAHVIIGNFVCQRCCGFRDAIGRSSTYALWQHDMESLSVLLTLCVRNPSVTTGFPSQMDSNSKKKGIIMWSCDVSLLLAWPLTRPLIILLCDPTISIGSVRLVDLNQPSVKTTQSEHKFLHPQYHWLKGTLNQPLSYHYSLKQW